MRKAIILLSCAVAISTIGYIVLEGVSFLDAFFMTIVTLSTVGYSEVFTLSETGKIFTSFMILVNIGVVAYALSVFTEYIVQGQFFYQRNKKRMENRVKKLSNHIIICGYSKYAEESILHFDAYDQEWVLIERSEGQLKEFQLLHPNGMFILGDASEDDILEMVQIKKAKAVICTMADKSENIFITLTARQLNPKIKIIARTADNRTETKLRKAGANHIIMPERISGFYMATVVNKPGTVEFFDQITNEWQSEVHIEEIAFDKVKTGMQNKSLAELNISQQTGANIIGFKDQQGQYIINPGGDTSLDQGTSLIALGTESQIKALMDMCG